MKTSLPSFDTETHNCVLHSTQKTYQLSSNTRAHTYGFVNPPVVLQVYDDLDAYHVTDMVEFVGILSKDPSLAEHDHDEENGQGEMSTLRGALSEDTAAERKAHNPPPSLVPRLHTIVAHKMSHSNPLLSKHLKDPISVSGK